MIEYSKWIRKGIPNRNRHVLFKLLQNKKIDKVLAVDFLPFTFKRAVGNVFENVWQDFGGMVLKKSVFSKLTQISSKLFVYSTVKSFLPGEKKVYREIEDHAAYLGLKNYGLWSYYPMFAGYLNYFKNCHPKVFDAVDNWVEHPNFHEYRLRLRRHYGLIDEKADNIFTVSKKLLALFPKNKNKFWISNGVDLEHFRNLGKSPHSPKLKLLSSLKKPLIGYTGIIQERLDLDLIEFLSLKNPEKSFVFLGPVWTKVDKLKRLRNVHFLGEVGYQDLPHVLKQFDLGIIPHQINDFTNSMNPLKLYEYLAAGLPVVTTPVSGTEQFSKSVFIAKSREEFDLKINKVIASNKNSRPELCPEEDLLKNYSWENKVNEMLDKIFLR